MADTLLEGGNYHIRSRKVKRSLGLKNKICFILDDTGIAKPKYGDKLYDSSKQADDMVITWLVKYMNHTIK